MKPEMTITVNLEPSPETVAACKFVLELWVNAGYGRDILVRERYKADGEKEVYLELVREEPRLQADTLLMEEAQNGGSD